MKSATEELKAFLASSTQFVMADLVTIATLRNGTIRVTSSDVDLNWLGVTYASDSLIVSGMQYRVSIGLDSNEQNVTVAVPDGLEIDGIPVLEAMRIGVFSGATFTRKRAFMPDWERSSAENSGIVGVVELFTGYVSTIDRIGRMDADWTVKDRLSLLDVNMPRRLWQAPCLNTVYDGGCTMLKADYTFSGAVGHGSTKMVINWASATADDYSLGTILFTSGANDGIKRTIKLSTAGVIELSYPLLYSPSVGDTFEATYGCDGTMDVCEERFSNKDNFIAFPYIPEEEKAL